MDVRALDGQSVVIQAMAERELKACKLVCIANANLRSFGTQCIHTGKITASRSLF